MASALSLEAKRGFFVVRPTRGCSLQYPKIMRNALRVLGSLKANVPEWLGFRGAMCLVLPLRRNVCSSY